MIIKITERLFACSVIDPVIQLIDKNNKVSYKPLVRCSEMRVSGGADRIRQADININ